MSKINRTLIVCIASCAVALSSCDDSSDRNGTPPQYKFVCQNGEPADGTTTDKDDNNCTECHTGYLLNTDDNSCIVQMYKYVCQNGEPADGTTTDKNVNNCTECHTGYLLNADDKSCTMPIGYLQPPKLIEGSITSSSAQISVVTSGSAKLHWVVYEDGVVTPTAAQLTSDAADESIGVARSGGEGVDIVDRYTINIDGLDDGVEYDVYTVLTPSTSEQLLSDRVDIMTTTVSPVFIEVPIQSSINQNSVAVDFAVNRANKLYWVLYDSTIADATALRIVTDATDANSAAISSGVLTDEVNKQHTVTISDLTSNSSYYFYAVAEDEDSHQTLTDAQTVFTPGDTYVCLHGTAVDGEIMLGENITKCASCTDYYRLTADAQCVATQYYCNDGIAASSSPQLDGHATTNANVELCRGTLNADHSIELLAPSDGTVPHGLWGDDDHIWLIDYPSKTIARYNRANRLSDTSKQIVLNSNNSEPHGMWGNDTTVWVADWTHKKLFAYTIASGEYDSSKDIPFTTDNDNPRGVWGDGTTIWVVDRTDAKLYAYAITDGSYDSSKDIDLHTDNIEPRGVWGNETTVWVADWDKQRLFAYTKSTGAYDSDKDIPLVDSNDTPRGVWGDGTTIWVADRYDGTLYAYSIASKAYDGQQTISLFNNDDPRDMWSDGNTLWVTESGDASGIVYAYDIASGEYSPQDTFVLSIENNDPGPLWGDGTTLWILDRTDRIIYAYSQSTKQRQPSKDIPVYWRNKNPQGMWGDGTIIWVSDRQNDREYGFALYAYHIANRTNLYGSHIISLAPDNRHPNGIWGDGTTIWVTDNVDDKLYAYTIATKAADSSKDLDLSVHNGDSYGIWSNGTAMWIVDDYDGLIYKYYW